MSDSQRIDRWLWHARLAKTRSLAAGLVAEGRVRLNRARVAKPSQPVKQGDVVTASLPGGVRVLRVEGFSERRGPASTVLALYTDLTPSEPEDAVAGVASPGTREPGAGRPTKRERRHLVAWKQSLPAPDD